MAKKILYPKEDVKITIRDGKPCQICSSPTKIYDIVWNNGHNGYTSMPICKKCTERKE